MPANLSLVLDVGKTNAKISLWNDAGACVARKVRANPAAGDGRYPALDLQGLETFVAETVREMAQLGAVRRIIPVTHGAAAVVMVDGAILAPPVDYEIEVSAELSADYDAQRDPFAATGSPNLPNGLNLGRQLHVLESLLGLLPEAAKIVLWPQYWAWRFCGVLASEVSSLGCHTDLWRPEEGRPSDLAIRRGWADRLPPVRPASAVLGLVTREWVEAGLPSDCAVLCGLHDSNSALVAARGHAEIAQNDATILSTGTWFVAMRSLGAGGAKPPPLDPDRDCLLNVDVAGRPAPSARFMGGRESERIAGLDSFHITENYNPEGLLADLPRLMATGAMVLPTFAPGFGPFPGREGQFINPPETLDEKRALLGLYLALLSDTCLDLIGTQDRILVEGRFAEAEVFVRALASLRAPAKVFVSNAHDDVPFGALRLVFPDLAPRSPLKAVEPLADPIDAYRAAWRRRLQDSPASP